MKINAINAKFKQMKLLKKVVFKPLTEKKIHVRIFKLFSIEIYREVYSGIVISRI